MVKSLNVPVTPLKLTRLYTVVPSAHWEVGVTLTVISPEPVLAVVRVPLSTIPGVVVALPATFTLSVPAPLNVSEPAVNCDAVPLPLVTIPPVPAPTVTAPTVPVPSRVPCVNVIAGVLATLLVWTNWRRCR